jgi:hypothetical protein
MGGGISPNTGKPLPTVNIWSVRGDPAEIIKKGLDPEAASIPESVLREKGILPPSIDMSSTPSPTKYAEGGVVDKLKALFGSDKSNVQKADDIDPVISASTDTVKSPEKMKNGGSVKEPQDDPVEHPEDLPTGDDTSWQDRANTIKQLLFKLGSSPAGQAAGAIMNPVSAIAGAAKNMAAPVLNAELPAVQNTANTMTAGAVPPAPVPSLQPQQAAPAPVSAPVAPSSPQPTAQSPQTKPPKPEAPAAIDIMSKLTNNDSEQMSALLNQLKDQDKRSQFAQALGVIADTFGNMGLAKAGMRPEEFKTPQMLAQMNETSKKQALENLTQKLAADPNSQTSRMAQMTLLQSMGIPQNDPRAAKIMAMPAQSITQLMPQMTDAVKNNIEKEKNLIMAKHADQERQLKEQEIAISAANAEKAAQVAKTQAAADVLKNISPMNNMLGGPDVRGAAKQTLLQSMGGGQAPMTATNKMGHKIVSHDGGRTWQPL